MYALQIVAGAGQPIVMPDYLRDGKVTTIVIMNPIYVSEIRNMVKAMDVSVNMLVA